MSTILKITIGHINILKQRENNSEGNEKIKPYFY